MPGRVTQAVISIASASEASKNASAETAESSESDWDWDPKKERRREKRRFFAEASPTTARASTATPYAPVTGCFRL